MGTQLLLILLQKWQYLAQRFKAWGGKSCLQVTSMPAQEFCLTLKNPLKWRNLNKLPLASSKTLLSANPFPEQTAIKESTVLGESL
jgi:hypothetical protein